MQLSQNILIIKNLQTTPNQTDLVMMQHVSKLEAEIQFHCPVTGVHFQSIVVTANNRAYDKMGALKKVIQDFMFGNAETESRFYTGHAQCQIHSKINHVEIRLTEPYKSLFEHLFNLSAWEIPFKELSSN